MSPTDSVVLHPRAGEGGLAGRTATSFADGPVVHRSGNPGNGAVGGQAAACLVEKGAGRPLLVPQGIPVSIEANIFTLGL